MGLKFCQVFVLPSASFLAMAQLRLSRDATLFGVNSFLDAASAAQANWKLRDDALVAAALGNCSGELARQAAEIAHAVRSASAGLQASLDAKAALADDHI